MYVCVAENCEMLVFFPFFPNNSSNRQLSFRVKVLNHMGWYLGHKGLLCLSWDNVLFFIFAFLRIFKIFHIQLEEKRKNVSFYTVYVCVKVKLTFFPFFFVHLSLNRNKTDLFTLWEYQMRSKWCIFNGESILRHRREKIPFEWR